jgi:hypothetical protein
MELFGLFITNVYRWIQGWKRFSKLQSRGGEHMPIPAPYLICNLKRLCAGSGDLVVAGVRKKADKVVASY